MRLRVFGCKLPLQGFREVVIIPTIMTEDNLWWDDKRPMRHFIISIRWLRHKLSFTFKWYAKGWGYEEGNNMHRQEYLGNR